MRKLLVCSFLKGLNTYLLFIHIIMLVTTDFIFNYSKKSDTVDMLSLLPTDKDDVWNLTMCYEFNSVTKISKSYFQFQGSSNQILTYLRTAFEMTGQDITPYHHVDVQISGFPCVAYYPKNIAIDTILNAVSLILSQEKKTTKE